MKTTFDPLRQKFGYNQFVPADMRPSSQGLVRVQPPKRMGTLQEKKEEPEPEEEPKDEEEEEKEDEEETEEPTEETEKEPRKKSQIAFTVTLGPDTYEAFEVIAKDYGMSINSLTRAALLDFAVKLHSLSHK